MFSIVLSCVVLFSLGVRGQEKTEKKLERILMVRSPGRISITQADLLQSDSLELAEPQMTGQILELDFEIKKRNALQLLKHQINLDGCDGSDIIPFSFLLGVSRKQRFYGAICTTRILIFDYIKELLWFVPGPSGFFSDIDLSDHACRKNKSRCNFKPSTFSFAVKADFFVCTIVIVDPEDPEGAEWFGHWSYQDSKAGSHTSVAFAISPIYVIDKNKNTKSICKSTKYHLFFSDTSDFMMLRHCPTSIPERKESPTLEFWKLPGNLSDPTWQQSKNDTFKLSASVNELRSTQVNVSASLVSVAMVSRYFVLFHSNYTLYFSTNELPKSNVGYLEVSSFGFDNNLETNCNRMALDVIGCTSLISIVNSGVSHYFLKFTEFSSFDGGLMQFNPVVVKIDSEIKKGLRLQNSIQLNHLILIQTAESKLMLLSRRNTSNVKTYDLGEVVIDRLSCFQLENQLHNKLDGYVFGTTQNRTAADGKVALRLLKVSLPYYEIVSHSTLEEDYCDNYLRGCRSLQLILTTNSIKYKKTVYLIGSSFTSVIKIKQENKINRLFNMNEFNLNLTEFFYGLQTNLTAKAVHQLQPTSANIGNVNDGPEVGRRVFPAEMSLEVDNENKEKDSTILSNIVTHEDETISVFMLVYSNSSVGLPRRVKLLHFFPSFPIEEEQITLPASYCTVRYLPFRKNNSTDYLLLDLTKNSSTQIVEFLEFYQNRSKLMLNRWSWYHNESRNITEEGDSFRIQMLYKERIKMVRFFYDGEAPYLLALSNQTIRLSQFKGKKPLQLHRLMNLTVIDIIRKFTNLVSTNDCAMHRDLLFIDLRVVVEHGNGKADTEHTRIYVMKLLFGKLSAQFIGYIQHEYLKPSDYHVYFVADSLKLIFVSLKTMVLYEYNIDDALSWIDQLAGGLTNKDVILSGPIEPNSAMNLSEFGQPQKMLTQLSKVKLGEYDKTTLTIRKDTSMFVIGATFTQSRPKSSTLTGNETLKYNLVFSSRLNNPLTILHLHPHTYSSFIQPILTGKADPDRLPVISKESVRSSIHRIHMNFYQTGKFMKVYYQKPYFRNGNNSTALNINFRDTHDTRFIEQFNITKDYRSNIIVPKPVSFNTSTLLLKFEDLGLISSVNYGCLDDSDTKLTWGRELSGFKCPNSRFSIDYYQPLQREGSLRLDGSNPKKVKELFPLDYETLNVSNYFLILYDDELAIVESYNHKLIYRAIINKIDYQTRSKIPKNFKLSDCSRINMLWTEPYYVKQVLFHMTLFCKIGGRNCETKVNFIFPLTALEGSEKLDRPLTLIIFESIEVNWEIWYGAVVMDEYRITANQILSVITEVAIQSVGTKRIIQSYYRDKETTEKPYVSVYSNLYDKYDSFDILSFYTEKVDCSGPTPNGTICIKYILLKYCSEVSKIKIFREVRKFNTKLLSKDQIESDTGSSLINININPYLHGQVKDGHIISNVDRAGVETIFYYLICSDYIYEYRWNFNSTANPHQLIARYNYLGLCSDSSYFKLDCSLEYLKVNCIPLDNDPYPNNILLFKRPPVPVSLLEKGNSGPPLNASHILTQAIGYSYMNSFNYLVKSQDSNIRLIKTSPTNLVEQYLVNPFAKLHVRRNEFKVFIEPEINVHLSNYYTDQNFTLKFEFNKTNAIRNVLEVLGDTVELVIVAAVYLSLLMGLLLIQKFHKTLQLITQLFSYLVRRWQMRNIRRKLKKYRVKFIDDEAMLIQNHFELENQSRQVASQLVSDTTF